MSESQFLASLRKPRQRAIGLQELRIYRPDKKAVTEIYLTAAEKRQLDTIAKRTNRPRASLIFG